MKPGAWHKHADEHLTAQTIGVGIAVEQAARAASESAALSAQDRALSAAQKAIEEVRRFVGTPEHILGSPETKHGEIAEHVQVGIENARALIDHRPPPATFHDVGRLDATDYLVNGIPVQSKYINGLNNNLQHILDHLKNYPNFAQGDAFYHIPNDHFQAIHEIAQAGSLPDLNRHTLDAIRDKIQTIQSMTGRDFTDVVRPGVANYAEVQQGTIHKTLNGYDHDLSVKNEELRREIHETHQPSMGGVAFAAAGGATLGASARLTSLYFEKRREGRDLFKGQFSSEDWHDFGIQGLEGAAKGGIAGGSIYFLTNVAGLSAPLAAGIVSSSLAVGDLAIQYQMGEITEEEFLENGRIACLEGGVVTLATLAGQTLIPIPVLGSLLGAMAGRVLVSVGGAAFGQTTDKKWATFQATLDAEQSAIDARYLPVYMEMIVKYDSLADLTSIAFDLERNSTLVRLHASIELARLLDVPEEEILTHPYELDRLMQGEEVPSRMRSSRS